MKAPFSPAIDRFVMQERRFRVLIIEDEPAVRRAIRRTLGSTHFVYSEAEGIEDALLRLSQRMTPDIVVLDLALDGQKDGGLAVLQHLDGRELRTDAIVFSGYADVPLTVEAMRLGAADVVTKGGDLGVLRDAVKNVLENLIARPPSSPKISGSRLRAHRPHVDGEAKEFAEKPTTFREEMERAKRNKIAEILAYTNGNFSEAARLAEMDPANLRRLALRLGIQPKIAEATDLDEKKKRSR